MENEETQLYNEINGEIILSEVRKHWIVYLEDIVFHGSALILFSGIAIFFSVQDMFISEGYIELIVLILALLTTVSFFASWTLNYFDVWHITSKHIVAVNQKDILNREEAYMEFSRIQDVFFEKEGILSVWLHYGALRIQSAGTEQQFVMRHVKEVEKVAHTIMDLRDKIKHQEV
jgi:uncharacterized membrane protein YdbT with pleckstrin-like domain